MDINKEVSDLFTMRNQIHYFHLQCKSFGLHIDLNELYDGLLEQIDELSECFMGKYGATIKYETTTITIVDFSDKLNLEDILTGYSAKVYLLSEKLMKDSKVNIDLQNICADIMNLFNKAIYKLRLK